MSEPEEKSLRFRLARALVDFIGSWVFVIILTIVVAAWIVLSFVQGVVDSDSLSLLNLALSILATFQTCLILIAQNKQEAKDRERAERDLKVNEKAEHEIRQLHDKMDRVMRRVGC